MDKDFSWLLFSYRVPAEPSTLRVRIWRNLKSLGVAYIQQSVCVAPYTPEVRKKLQQMQNLISDSGGESLLLEIAKFSENTEEQLISIFNEQRLKEYEEFLGGCNNFLKEIEMETARENYTFHEVEENEADLVKLKRWHKKIVKRDFFTSSTLSQAKKQLEQCEVKLAEFTKRVYQSEGCVEGQILQEPQVDFEKGS